MACWDGAADIVTILLPPGLPWDNIEATLRAAAPDKGPPA
jgi:5,10-methylenetetrahydromethanopterin reductase